MLSTIVWSFEPAAIALWGRTSYAAVRLRGKIDSNKARGKAPFERTDTTSCYSAPIAHGGFPVKVVLAVDPWTSRSRTWFSAIGVGFEMSQSIKTYIVLPLNYRERKGSDCIMPKRTSTK